MFLAVLFLLLLSLLLEAGNGKKGKIIVFGFRSSVINDVQSRLLRERVLWKLQKRDYQIVPVMEYERVFREKPESYMRTMNRFALKKYSAHFRVDYAVTGSLEPKIFNRSTKDIRPNVLYTCRIIIYSSAEDNFIFLNFDIDGCSNYFQFFEKLSGKIVSGYEKAVRQ
jgi:hypothetical protein